MSRLALGKTHALVVSEEELWGCGDNTSSQLGYLSVFKLRRTKMKPFKKTPPVVSTFAGPYNTLFIDIDGKTWVCGDNCDGQLGIGKTKKFLDKPHLVPDLPPLKSIAANYYHSVFLDQEGFVWSCGKNQFGEAGLGDFVSRNKPEKVTTLPPIQAVGCGQNFSIFLDIHGNAWGAGDASFRCISKSTRCPIMFEEIPKIKTISVADFASTIHHRGQPIDSVW